MYRWIPPPRTKIVYHLGALRGSYHPSIVPDGALTVDQCNRLLREFFDRFELRFKDGHSELRLDDSRWPDMLEFIAESESRGELSIRGEHCSGWIEEPQPNSRDKNAWFLLNSGAAEFRSASRVRPGVHFSWDDCGHVADEDFLNVVLDEQLSGLQSIPLVGKMARGPKRWFDVYASEPLGRGLDHPLIDPEKRKKRFGSSDENRERVRTGDGVAWDSIIRDDAVLDHPVARRLRELANGEFFRIQGPVRYVQELLPDSDFAYVDWSYRDDPEEDARVGRSGRSIACNARTRKLLIDSGVMKPSRFHPLPVVPRTSAESAILDEVIGYPLPLPRYTEHEAEVERTRRARVAEKEQSVPVSITTLEDAILLLKQTNESAPDWWVSTETHGLLELIRGSKHYNRFPTSLQQVIALLPMEFYEHVNEEDSFDRPILFGVTPPRWNDWLPDEKPAEPEDAPSRKDLVFAEAPYGDWFSFRATDPALPADARITYWDHETLCPHDEWPSVAAFVQHLIELLPRASATLDDE